LWKVDRHWVPHDSTFKKKYVLFLCGDFHTEKWFCCVNDYFVHGKDVIRESWHHVSPANGQISFSFTNQEEKKSQC